MRLTLGDGTTIDIEPGAELTEVRLRPNTFSDHRWVPTADVAAWARDLLREIDGPSIDDVRGVWGIGHADMEIQAEDVFSGITEATVCVWNGSRHQCFDAPTLREALQAAYDAGVARAAAAVPPA